MLNQNIIPTSTHEASRKSTNGTSTPAKGSKSRGKYTFVTSVPFETSEVLETCSAAEKYCHARIPAKAKIGYGRLPEGNRANLPKTSEYTMAVKSGWKIAQPAPIAVCL